MDTTETTPPQATSLEEINQTIQTLEAQRDYLWEKIRPLQHQVNALQQQVRTTTFDLAPLYERRREIEEGPKLHHQTIAGCLRRGGHKPGSVADAGYLVSKDNDRSVVVTYGSGVGWWRDYPERKAKLDGYMVTLTQEGYEVERRSNSLVVKRKRP